MVLAYQLGVVFCATVSRRGALIRRGERVTPAKDMLLKGHLMRNTLFKATLVGAVLAISGVTYAGLNSINPVEIFTESSTGTLAAHGSMRDARNSSDSSSYIGCWQWAFS